MLGRESRQELQVEKPTHWNHGSCLPLTCHRPSDGDPTQMLQGASDSGFGTPTDTRNPQELVKTFDFQLSQCLRVQRHKQAGTSNPIHLELKRRSPTVRAAKCNHPTNTHIVILPEAFACLQHPKVALTKRTLVMYPGSHSL